MLFVYSYSFYQIFCLGKKTPKDKLLECSFFNLDRINAINQPSIVSSVIGSLNVL